MEEALHPHRLTYKNTPYLRACLHRSPGQIEHTQAGDGGPPPNLTPRYFFPELAAAGLALELAAVVAGLAGLVAAVAAALVAAADLAARLIGLAAAPDQ